MHFLPAFTGSPEVNKVYNLDIFDLCAAMPDQSVDMILCDLPYGTTACAWDVLIPFEPMWAAFKRIIKPNGAIVLTASQPFTSILVCSNLKMFRYAWVWDKVRPVGFQIAKYRPMMQHEDVLLFSSDAPCYYPEMGKRDKARSYKVYGSSLSSPLKHSDNIIRTSDKTYPASILRFYQDPADNEHSTQKPADLFRYLIRTYTQPGQLIFDPCVGSGTTAYAARAEGRNYIVGDQSAEYVQVARNRLAQPYTPMFAELLMA